MYYYKARIYSPSLGRFLQADPIGYADGMSWYAYAGNDPVNMHDPTGLDMTDCNGNPATPEEIPVCGGRSKPSLSGYGGVPAQSAADRRKAMLPGEVAQSAHYYSNRSRVIPCAASDAQIADLARRFAAPGQPAGPISNGQRSIASTPIGSGPVRSTYYSYGNYGTSVITTLNVTLPGHPLHNGSVSRDWFRGADGAVWVETIGRGTNTGDFVAGANQVVGPVIFRGVDAAAADYAAENICGRQ